MAMHKISSTRLAQDAPGKAGAERLLPPRNDPKDVFLSALLEMPTTKQARRSPLEWAGAMGLHLVILALLIIVPLYTTGTIHLPKFDEVPLVAPPPPPALPAAGTTASPRIARPRAHFTYTVQKHIPNSIPRRVTQESASAAAPPDLGGVAGGVPGGVVGGEIGGLAGGTFGSTGTAAPPPPSHPQPTKRVVRAGSLLKPPRQTKSIAPEYPPLALQTRISGIVMIDAIIDEGGNVVQARAVSGHPLLIAAALRAVLPVTQPKRVGRSEKSAHTSTVQVHFDPKS